MLKMDVRPCVEMDVCGGMHTSKENWHTLASTKKQES